MANGESVKEKRKEERMTNEGKGACRAAVYRNPADGLAYVSGKSRQAKPLVEVVIDRDN